MKYFVLGLFVLLNACAPKPTKVYSDSPVVSRRGGLNNKLAPGVVILDVRPPFEFNLSHIPGAINVAWEDFSRSAPDHRGLLHRDTHSITRRLALVGVDTKTPVLIVGKAKGGRGEDGRVAWTLASLGVEDVEIAPSENFREKKDEGLPVANKAFWDAKVNSSFEITWTDLKNRIQGKTYHKSKARKKSLGAVPLPAKEEPFVVIDVRAREEVSIDNLNMRTPRTINFKNIDWRDFFTDQMDPNPVVMKLLNEMGVSQTTEVYLISNHGVRSGAATWALQRLGYKKAKNFAGGYEQIPWRPR